MELVRGLGETLVGNYPGAALAAVIDKKAIKAAASDDADPLTVPTTSAEAVQCVPFHFISCSQWYASRILFGDSDGVMLPCKYVAIH